MILPLDLASQASPVKMILLLMAQVVPVNTMFVCLFVGAVCCRCCSSSGAAVVLVYFCGTDDVIMLMLMGA